VRLPETPVNTRVEVDAAAPDVAVSVVFCAVPGISESVDGLAVTPVGSPVIVMVTVPVKPLAGTAFTATGWPVPPATIVSFDGAAVSEKSGGGGAVEMVSAAVAEWLSVPDVPVKVTVELPAVAVEAAVSVTFCAVPGVKESVAGLAVTPVGSPVIVMVTVPVKPMAGTAFTATGWPVPPATIVSFDGEAVTEKSGGGGAVEMVSAAVAEWLRAPDVPVKVTVELPAVAVEAAVSVTFCAVPGVKESVAGLAVTPVGSPVSETATAPEKPLPGTAFTLIFCPWPPATIVTVAGVAVIEKSCGCAGFETEPDTPPQEITARHRNKQAVIAIAEDSCSNRLKPDTQAALGAEEQAAHRRLDSIFCNQRPHGENVLIGQ